jgi:hypothetical protein
MAIRITSRFATPMETADRLGVPRSRAMKLIELLHSAGRTAKKNAVIRHKKKTASPKRKLSKRQMRAKFSKAAR